MRRGAATSERALARARMSETLSRVHPYRARIPRPPNNESTVLQSVARKAVFLTEIPLAIVAASFFLPIDHDESAASMLLKGEGWGIVILWPMHLAALVLLILIERARRAHRARPRAETIDGRPPIPSSRSRLAALVTTTIAACGSALLVVYARWHGNVRLFGPWTQLGAMIGVAVALSSVAFAKVSRGWHRFAFVVLAYAGAVTGIVLLYAFAAVRERHVGIGVYTVLGSTACLYALAGIASATRGLLWLRSRGRRG